MDRACCCVHLHNRLRNMPSTPDFPNFLPSFVFTLIIFPYYSSFVQPCANERLEAGRQALDSGILVQNHEIRQSTRLGKHWTLNSLVASRGPWANRCPSIDTASAKKVADQSLDFPYSAASLLQADLFGSPEREPAEVMEDPVSILAT